MLSPSPTSLQDPFNKICLTLSKLLQVHEAPFTGGAFHQFLPTLYLAKRTLIQGMSLPERTHQANLANIAAFILEKLLNPNPPSLRGLQITSHALGEK